MHEITFGNKTYLDDAATERVESDFRDLAGYLDDAHGAAAGLRDQLSAITGERGYSLAQRDAGALKQHASDLRDSMSSAQSEYDALDGLLTLLAEAGDAEDDVHILLRDLQENHGLTVS